MRTLVTISLAAIIAAAIIVPGQAQVANQTIGFNPTGLALEGLSYFEYERQINATSSVVFKLNHIHYTSEESDYSYDYAEEGTGIGLGVGGKYYINAKNEDNGLFVGSSIDFVSVNWKWAEIDRYGVYAGDGTTTALAFSAQFGFKAMISPKFFISPSFIIGWASLDVEGIQGIGLFYTPAVTMSMML